MERLVFRVQGSQASPYVVTATGVGGEFQIHCSCPASRRAAKMCKHAAALLVGDVTKLVQPSDCVVALSRMADGSDFVARAIAHSPVSRRQGLDVVLHSMEDVAAYVSSLVAEKGFEMAVEPYGDGTRLAVYGRLKSGRRKKHPFLVLAHQHQTSDLVIAEDGSLQAVNFRLRDRPFSVVAASKTVSWKDFQGAAAAFVTALKAA